jgi:threonine synthase
VARWLPQQFYYLFAWQQWKDKRNPPVISVPSGNFGNICAGLLAYSSGLPVKHFIAACNANAVVPAFLQSGEYQPKPAVATISNAMDVGDPSNFVRVLELFNQELGSLRNVLTSYSVSDVDTKKTIREVYSSYGYLTDPHGAVGYKALQQYLQEHADDKGFFLETAHPVKFYDVVEPVIHSNIPLPDAVREVMHLPKESVVIDANYEELKDNLQQLH